MKHRTLALLLAATMLIALPACGGNADDPGPVPCASPEAPSSDPADTAPAQNDGPAADAAEPEPSDAVSQPAPSPGTPAENPSQAPSQAPQPNEQPSAAPSQSGSVDLQAFYESLTENEEFGANMPVEGDFLTMYYPGLSDIATRQQVIYMPMISSVVCEIALVEVENSADVQAVKDIFQARIDSQVGTDDEPGGAFYPASIEAWKNNSRIVSNGNCVMLIAWSNCDSAVTAFDGLF